MEKKREEKLLALAPALLVCRLIEHNCIDTERLQRLAKLGTDAIVNYIVGDDK